MSIDLEAVAIARAVDDPWLVERWSEPTDTSAAGRVLWRLCREFAPYTFAELADRAHDLGPLVAVAQFGVCADDLDVVGEQAAALFDAARTLTAEQMAAAGPEGDVMRALGAEPAGALPDLPPLTAVEIAWSDAWISEAPWECPQLEAQRAAARREAKRPAEGERRPSRRAAWERALERMDVTDTADEPQEGPAA